MNIIEARSAFYAGKPREERRQTFEVRETDGGGLSVVGYASVTGVPYGVTDFLGEYTETITRGAFKRSLNARDDVYLLFDHDGLPLARSKSGTLQLAEDDLGLHVEANLDGGSPLAQSIRSALARGDLDQMSFAFRATQQEWNADYTARTIREVQLYDVSIVKSPANPATSVKLRSRWDDLEGKLREGRALDAPDLNMLTQALGWFSAIDNIVDAAQANIAQYVGVENPDVEEADAEAERAVNPFALKAAALRKRAAA